MKRFLLLFVVVAVCGQHAYSQQDPKYTHYMFNQVVYNPGFIGVENGDNVCINLVYRNQWLGFDPSSGDGSVAPITTTLTLHTPLKIPNSPNKLGVGLVVSSDKVGFMNDVWAHANVNYIYQLGPRSQGRTISGGLTMGIMQKAITPTFEAVNGGDPVLTAIGGNASDVIFDLGLGALYNTKDYFVGISTLHLPQTQFDWYGGTANIPGSGLVNRVGRHVYLNGGYNLALGGNPDLVLQPRTLLKFDRAKFQWDLGSLIELNQKYWGGLNIRGGEGIMFLAGFRSINTKGEGFKIGLSYDLTLSKMQSVSNGTIELMGNYCFPVSIKPDEPDPDLLPRFLGGYSR